MSCNGEKGYSGGDMSYLYHQTKEEDDFDAWLEEGSWTRLAGDFYECAGNHVWHEDDVVKQYKEACDDGWGSQD